MVRDMENKVLLSIKDLSIGHEGRILCSGISFDICEGDCIMLCGANGSGKTTLMKTLASITPDNDRSESPKCIMIPARIPKVAGFTLKEFVRVSCFSKSDLFGKLSTSEEEALDQAIAALGLTNLADRDISTLSDGEFQKAGIASALVRKADIIMLDEPTAFLDAENRISVLSTLRKLCKETATGGYGKSEHRPAIIFSTHDLHDGLAVCTKVFALGADKQFHTSSADDSTDVTAHSSGDSPESKAATVSRIFSR